MSGEDYDAPTVEEMVYTAVISFMMTGALDSGDIASYARKRPASAVGFDFSQDDSWFGAGDASTDEYAADARDKLTDISHRDIIKLQNGFARFPDGDPLNCRRKTCRGADKMALFDLFRNKKVELTVEQQKWNRMWDLWAKGQVESPYAQLMTYQSEIYNGGHAQYFDNIENTGDLQKEMSELEKILPMKLKNNLKRAYKANVALEEEYDERTDAILERCDNVFYDNEKIINRILEEFSAKF